MKSIKAEIIAIGDELLYGQVVDTNSHWISGELSKIGVKVANRSTVGDDRASILKVFEIAEKRADVILITGGLGPTKDDLTKPLLAEYFQCGIELVPQALEDIREFFEKRGRELTPLNALQARLPTKCSYVRNEAGTAPGMWFEENGAVWMSMPGVPHEMEKQMLDFVIPRLKNKYILPHIYHKVIKTVGIGESWLADMLQDWEESIPEDIQLAYLPSIAEVKLRLTATGDKPDLMAAQVEELIQQLPPSLGQYIYGYDDDTLPGVVGKLMIEKNKKIALAESCSGGYLSYLITGVPGASAYLNGGIIPYHNEFKASLVGVDHRTLESVGAVSEETVKEMAKNIRRKFNTDIGLSTSGIAGPSGGSEEKPVGTVWIACDYSGKVTAKKLRFGNDRAINIHSTAIAALNLLRKCLLGIEEI